MEGQKKYKDMTSKDILTSIVNKDEDVDMLTKKLLKRLNGVIHDSFKKVRITEDNTDDDIVQLFDQRRALRSKKDEDSKKLLKQIDDKLADKCADNNVKIIREELKDIGCDEGGFNVGRLWKLRKKLCPYKKDTPTAMLDPHGNIVTSAEGIQTEALNHYKRVLANRPIQPDLIELKNKKEELCGERIKQAKLNKSAPWTEDDLEVVLKFLKKGKSRDPNDHPNELYNMEWAGKDLKHAILILMNKIKDQQQYPQALQTCNISSIYKKGKRNIFGNYRGVFRLTVLRSILDRLIYNDVYPVVDSNLTDANVGARKGRNIRDNLFVLNAVTNSVTRGKEDPCEIGIYDAEKCFDSLWAEDCINDLFEAGCNDDKLVLLHLGTQNANIAIKTPHGLTKREIIQNIIMQGGVFGPLQCTTSMDKLAKEVYSRPDLLYLYKGAVEVPPLLMVDNILTISKCSTTALAMNSTVNAFIASKKLKLSYDKCREIHVGKSAGSCHDLKVHGKTMHRESSTKYLGDIFHNSGRSRFNIIERSTKAYAILAEI